MIQQIKTTRQKVKLLLQENSKLRDSDQKLIAVFWNLEYKDMDQDYTVLTYLYHGKLTTPEAITRARRLVQSMNPELRGENYKGRMDEEKEVRKEIKKL